jgi:hypothetical protein
MYRVSQPAYVYLLVGVNRDLCSVCAHVALVGWRLPQASRFFRPRSLPRLGYVARGHGGIGVWRIVLIVLTFGWGVCVVERDWDADTCICVQIDERIR